LHRFYINRGFKELVKNEEVIMETRLSFSDVKAGNALGKLSNVGDSVIIENYNGDSKDSSLLLKDGGFSLCGGTLINIATADQKPIDIEKTGRVFYSGPPEEIKFSENPNDPSYLDFAYKNDNSGKVIGWTIKSQEYTIETSNAKNGDLKITHDREMNGQQPEWQLGSGFNA
jgi:hypothetical protein